MPQTTSVQNSSTLTFNPGTLTTISYAGNVVNDGVMRVQSGTVQNMGIISGSPLQQGWLSRRFDQYLDNPPHWLAKPRREQFRALYALVDELGMPLTDLAIRWVISNPDIDTTLMGAKSVHEVEMNVAAVNAGPLPADVMARLQEIGDMVPFRPSFEPFGCVFGWDGYRGPGI